MSRTHLHTPLIILKNISDDIASNTLPAPEISLYSGQSVLPLILVKNTRGYIEKLVYQINGCYDNAWYDACAVMIRRLVEVLIIEVYEKDKRISNITDSKRNTLYMLDGLITVLLNDSTWKLGRNTITGLPKIKNLGDKSAHTRRYNALRNDIDNVKSYLRDIVDELVNLAQLKRA